MSCIIILEVALLLFLFLQFSNLEIVRSAQRFLGTGERENENFVTLSSQWKFVSLEQDTTPCRVLYCGNM